MHILVGLITIVGGLCWLLYVLQRSGVNLNDINPFYNLYRKQWQYRLGVKSLYQLGEPIDVAACLIVGVAILDGEITAEQKRDIQKMFEGEFNISEEKALELFVSSSYLLKDTVLQVSHVKNIIEPCKKKFTTQTQQSLIRMLEQAANIQSKMSNEKKLIITRVDDALKSV